MTFVARLGVFLLSLAVIAGVLPTSAAQSKDKPAKEKGFSYKETLRSTVWVVVRGQPIDEKRYSISMGTGSLIDLQRGLVLTNYHVVRNRDEARIFFPIVDKGKIVPERKRYIDMLNTEGGYINGRVIGREESCDLALIQLERVPQGAVALKLAAASPEPAQRVHSIGNPGASEALWVYTPGTVRQVYRKKFRSGGRSGDPIDVHCMIVETESPVNSGDSGGPVLNDKGELVAVVQGHIADEQARSMSYFIDVSEVKQFYNRVVKGVKQVPNTGAIAEGKPKAEAPADKPAPTVNTSEDEKNEQFANFRLRQAKAYDLDGNANEARKYAQEVVDKYPDSKAAVEAKKLLERLKKK